MTLDQESLDAVRLERARADEQAARDVIAETKRERDHLRAQLRETERRLQESVRRAERAAGVRRALELGRRG